MKTSLETEAQLNTSSEEASGSGHEDNDDIDDGGGFDEDYNHEMTAASNENHNANDNELVGVGIEDEENDGENISSVGDGDSDEDGDNDEGGETGESKRPTNVDEDVAVNKSQSESGAMTNDGDEMKGSPKTSEVKALSAAEARSREFAKEVASIVLLQHHELYGMAKDLLPVLTRGELVSIIASMNVMLTARQRRAEETEKAQNKKEVEQINPKNKSTAKKKYVSKTNPFNKNRLSRQKEEFGINRAYRTWDENYELLRKYKIENGNFHVPLDYNDASFAKWVQRQKIRKKELNQERLDKLLKIGFSWEKPPKKDRKSQQKEKEGTNKAHRSWDESYELLRQYKIENGNCNVPRDYINDTTLARWILEKIENYNHTLFRVSINHAGTFSYQIFNASSLKVCLQRQKCRKNELEQDRVDKLLELGFSWKKCIPLVEGGNLDADELWNFRYSQLEEYYKEHGNSCIPLRYPKNKQLGKWVCTQKVLRRKHHPSLTPERVAKLCKLNFDWGKRISEDVAGFGFKRQWEFRYQQLLDYRAETGRRMVPPSDEKNKHLMTWVLQQKRTYRDGTMVPERKAKIDTLGFRWEWNARNKAKNEIADENTTDEYN